MYQGEASGVMCPCGHTAESHEERTHGCRVSRCSCAACLTTVMEGTVTEDMLAGSLPGTPSHRSVVYGLGSGFDSSTPSFHMNEEQRKQCDAIRAQHGHVRENQREQDWFHNLLAEGEMPVNYAPVAKVAFLGLAPWFGLAVITEDRLFAFKIDNRGMGEIFSWPWAALENIYWVPELTGQATAKVEPYGASRVQLRVLFRRHTYAFDEARLLWMEGRHVQPRLEHMLAKGDIVAGEIMDRERYQQI